MDKERTDKENKYNEQHFKLKILGVHGGDLPQFHQTNKEWWKLRDNYVENPINNSHHQVVQDNKFWSRNDLMLLADFSSGEAPKDPHKVLIKSIIKKGKCSEKPNHQKRFKINKNIKNGPSNAIRWSEQEGRRRYKGRLFDKVRKAVVSMADDESLYSSFNKGGVFIPPPCSKDALLQQKKTEFKT
jgi:hypothetical protein